MDPTESNSATPGPSLLFASVLISYAAGGVLLAAGLSSYALTAGATSRSMVTVLASMVPAAFAGAVLAKRMRRRLPASRLALAVTQCVVVLGLVAGPLAFAATRFAYLRLWPFLGGTASGDLVLRFGMALALFGPAAAALVALALEFLRLAGEEGAGEGPATGILLGLAGAGLANGHICGAILLLPGVGVRSTFVIGLGIGGIAAALTALTGRKERAATPAAATAGATAAASAAPGLGLAVRWAAGCLGAGLAAAAIGWGHVGALIAGPTATNQAAWLTVIVLGIGLGGLLGVALPATLGPRGAALFLVAGALLVQASLYAVPATALHAARLAPGLVGLGGPVLLAALVACVTALPGSIVAGWALAALAGVLPGPRPGASPGADGDGRAAATLLLTAAGAGIGAFATTLGLLPALGLRRLLAVAAAAFAVGAVGLLWATAARVTWMKAAAAAAPLLLAVGLVQLPAAWDPRLVAGGVYRYGISAPEKFGSVTQWIDGRLRGEAPLFYREGTEAVAVIEHSVQRTQGLDPFETYTLTLDGRAAAGTGTDLRTQVLAGTLPVLLHGPTEKALLIEMLTGVTAGSMLRHPLKSLVVIEREPVVVSAAAFFDPLANQALADPRLRVVHDDPRARLLADRSRYDVIVMASGDPWLPHAAALMTREGYGLVRARLAEGGVFAQRISLGAFPSAALKSLLRTFADAFRSVLVFQLTPDDLLVAGSDRDLRLDGSWIRTVVGSNEEVRQDLGRAVIVGANELIMTLRLDRDALLKVTDDGPLNVDDRALVTRLASRDLAVHRNEATVAAMDAAWPGFAGLLETRGAAPSERADFLYSLAKSYLGLSADPVRALDLARDLSSLGALPQARWVTGEALLQQKDFDGALREWESVLALEPDNLDALFSLGTFYLDGHDDRKAETYLKRAVSGHPDASVVCYHYGRVLFNLGRFSEAIDMLRKARPRNAYPLTDYLVGLAADRLKRDDDAIAALKDYLTWAYTQQILTRVEVDAHLKLAGVFDRKGRRFDALQERQKADRLREKIEAWGRMQEAARAAPAAPGLEGPASGAATPGTPPEGTVPGGAATGGSPDGGAAPRQPPAPDGAPASPGDGR
jgi:spermidine synthase/Tfp pilus assembly protein PilF